MDEKKNGVVENVQDTVEQTEVAEVAAETATAENQDGEVKKKKKLPAWLQKLVDKINSNEDVRQMVLFTLFSFICGASQLVITYLLSLLRFAGGVLEAKFAGLPVGTITIFGYPTTAEFIGFLVGSIVGQVLTFVLNRKKTFKATNNIVVSVIMYVILALFIIFMQTLLGGAVTQALWAAKPDADEFLKLVFNLVGQLVAGIAALIISFLGNKFLVMRDWGKKKREKQAAQVENGEKAETQNGSADEQ